MLQERLLDPRARRRRPLAAPLQVVGVVQDAEALTDGRRCLRPAGATARQDHREQLGARRLQRRVAQRRPRPGGPFDSVSIAFLATCPFPFSTQSLPRESSGRAHVCLAGGLGAPPSTLATADSQSVSQTGSQSVSQQSVSQPHKRSSRRHLRRAAGRLDTARRTTAQKVRRHTHRRTAQTFRTHCTLPRPPPPPPRQVFRRAAASSSRPAD